MIFIFHWSKYFQVASSTIKPTVVARVTFDSSLATSEGFQSGKLIIKSKNSQHRVILPWMVNVLKGSLHWNQTISKFLVTDSPDPEDPSQVNEGGKANHNNFSPEPPSPQFLTQATSKYSFLRSLQYSAEFSSFKT